MADAGLEREVQGDLGAENPVARGLGDESHAAYIEAAVRHAYRLGARDGFALARLLDTPSRIAVLKLTHGLLTPNA